MEKRKIKYNHRFLSELVRRVTAHGRGTKSQVVDAMNVAGNAKKVTLNLLQDWSKPDAYVPIDRVINLVNNMSDVTLGDFFIYEDGTPADILPREQRSKTTAAPSVREDGDTATQMKLEMLELRLANAQERELLMREHEDAVKSLTADYEKRLAAQKSDYEQRLKDLERLMQATIDSQRETIIALRENNDGEKKDGDHRSLTIAADDRH